MSISFTGAGGSPGKNDDAPTGQGQGIEMEQAFGNRLAGNSTTTCSGVYDASDAFHERRIRCLKVRIISAINANDRATAHQLWPAFVDLILSRSPAQVARMEAEFWGRAA